MKRVIFTRQSQVHANGCYNDSVEIVDNENGVDSAPLYYGPARTWPNPYRPTDKVDCTQAYGAVAPGKYSGQFYTHYSDKDPFTSCILINAGGFLPCLWPNMNHGGQMIVGQVFVHHGWSDSWSGSAGCQTVPPENATKFFGIFTNGETVSVEIVDGSAV
jgi:hypothetical protein